MKDLATEELFHVGDVLFRVGRDGISEVTIMEINHYPHTVYRDDHGHSYFNHSIRKRCFMTKEEAEREIQKRNNIATKRKMLKEYEVQLNYELGIENHFIIK